VQLFNARILPALGVILRVGRGLGVIRPKDTFVVEANQDSLSLDGPDHKLSP
jgi:hypothetical protein